VRSERPGPTKPPSRALLFQLRQLKDAIFLLYN
jgi:hypothetical protein